MLRSNVANPRVTDEKQEEQDDRQLPSTLKFNAAFRTTLFLRRALTLNIGLETMNAC